MTAIMNENVRSAYRCSVLCSYIRDDTETPINPSFIKYITTEYLYYKSFMPIIYISMVIKNELYTDLVEHEKDAKLYLRISRHNVYSNITLEKKYIEGQFTYIVSTSNPNYSEVLADQVTADNSYKGITLALMSMEILNTAKTSYNGIFGNIDMGTLVLKAIEGMNIVAKPLLYNPTFDTIIVPALNSKRRLLQFLFSQCPFYDTEFMFFSDFDRSYLLDWTGEYLDAHDGQYGQVYFDVPSLLDGSAFYEGMEVRNNAYYFYINPAKTNITFNKGLDKISNQVVYIDDSGNVKYTDLNINNNIDSDLKQTFRRGANAILEKNTLESSTIFMDIVKEHIDSSVLTPNKQYLLRNYSDYADYNGNYALFYKKEILKNINGEFGISVNIGLRKVGNIMHLGASVMDTMIKKTRSAASRHIPVKRTTRRVNNSNNTRGTNSNVNTSFQTTSSNQEEERNIYNPTANVTQMPNIIQASDDSIIRRSIDKIS